MKTNLKLDPNKNPKYFDTPWNNSSPGYFVKLAFDKPYGKIKKLIKVEGLWSIYNQLFNSLNYDNTNGPEILKYKEFEFHLSCFIGGDNSFYYCYDLKSDTYNIKTI
jgi:hypothetical protein